MKSISPLLLILASALALLAMSSSFVLGDNSTNVTDTNVTETTIMTNITATETTWPNGTWPNETWPNGTWPNETWPNGTWPNETWPNATWPTNSSTGWWAWISVQPMDGTFDLPTFITELATLLNVSKDVFNGTIGGDGTVHITIYAANAMDIALQATQLSPNELTTLHVTTIMQVTTSTFASFTTITGLPPTNTTPTGTMPTNMSTMPSGTMPPPPPPPPACYTFAFHGGCARQSHCQEYNMTCVPRCSYAMNSTQCGMWSHCWVDSISNPNSPICKTKCSGLMGNACISSNSCKLYNGQCGLACNAYGQDSTKCDNDYKCMYNNNMKMCMPHCNLGVDLISCVEIIGSKECSWNPRNETCYTRCKSYTAATCSSASSTCQVFYSGTNWASCSDKCSLAMDWKSCSTMNMCSWSNGGCHPDCGTLTTSNACSSNPICMWWATTSTCSVRNCSAFGTDVQTCVNDRNKNWCTIGRNMTCKNACNQNMDNSSCSADPSCWWNSTTMMCYTQPCSAVMYGDVCNYRSDCVWVVEPTQQMGSCKPTCGSADRDKMLCQRWGHCWWDDMSWECTPKCNMQTTMYSCLGSNMGFPGTSEKGPCYWGGDVIGCQRDECDEYNSSACSASTSCSKVTNEMVDMCLPNCARATTEALCMNAYFQNAMSCFWDGAANTCSRSCAFIADRSMCTGACWWNSNFSVCVNKRMPPMNMSTTSTTMMTESAAAATNTTTMTEQTSTSSQSQGTSSTTAMAATNTTTPAPTTTTTTTAAPMLSPRAQFILDASARARANTTAENFKTQLALLLGVPASALAVTYDQSAGAMIVEFKADAKDAAGNAINITAEFQQAVTLDNTQLGSLGAASVTSIAPATTQAAPEDGPDVAVIAGAAAGGFVFLLIILFIIKKQTSAGTGYSENNNDQPGDRPMLELPQNGNRNSML